VFECSTSVGFSPFAVVAGQNRVFTASRAKALREIGFEKGVSGRRHSNNHQKESKLHRIAM
jgi:hypothetical protein